MSWFDAFYGGNGHGVAPDEPEKTGLRRFGEMVGRDFGQLIGTNFLACLLLLPAALGVSLGVVLLNFPVTLLAGIVTGLLAGIALLLLADCSLRSLCNDPSPWLHRAGQTIKARWKTALPLGSILITLLGGLSFVCAFMLEVIQTGQYPGGAVLVFLGFDLLVLAVGGSLAVAALAAAPPEAVSLGVLFRTTGQMLLTSPGRCVAGGAVVLAGGAILIGFFPVSTFWAMLFGFWLPVLIAMQIFFPMLRERFGLNVARRQPEPEPDHPLTGKEKKAKARANWWYYNWGLVLTAFIVVVAVIYVVYGLTTTVDPDYSVAVVTSDTLPDASAFQLQQTLESYGEDRNGDGAVVVELNVYTWSANASATDLESQAAGATRMNTDLANGDSGIWILDDPAGFEEAYGALSKAFGEDWASHLYNWTDVPALAGADLGSYDTTADGSASQSVQALFANDKIAVLDDSDGLWAALLADGG